MPYTTEQFVRGAVGELLRGAAHGKFWCQTCLAKFALETLGAGYHRRDIGRAMDKVFEAPSPLNRIPAFVCAQCGRTMPCLGCRLRDDASRQCRKTVKKNARERGERRYDQSRSDPGVVCCLIACARRVYWPGSRRQEQSVTQRFGNPTIGKQRKSKQFKSARVVKTLPRTGVSCSGRS